MFEAVYERDHARKWCLAVFPKGAIPKSSVNGSAKERSTSFEVPDTCLNADGSPNLALIEAAFPAPNGPV